MSFSGDVVVNPLVYEGLRDLLKGDDAGSFLKGFIGIVEEFGFFDAHHEPIVNFLFDQKGEAQINPQPFTLEDANVVAALLPGYDSNSWRPKNVRKQKPQVESSNLFRRIKTFRRNLNGNERIDVYPLDHPMVELFPASSEPLSCDDIRIQRKLMDFYDELREFGRENWCYDFIQSYYARDLWLYENTTRKPERLEDLRLLSQLI